MPAITRVLAVILVSGLIAGSGLAEDWTRFRGPNGSGVSASTGLPTEFGPQSNIAWSTEIPFARSSPVFAGDKIFLTAIDGDKFSTLALDRSSGRILWQREIERDRTDEFHQATDSATPSPVTDGSNVYAFFQETGLVSYTAEGEKRWELGLGPFRNFYGIAASPVLAGDTLLQLCDQATGSFLLAVDKASGKELWRQARPARLESYTTPVLYPNASQPKQIIVFGSGWVDAYDPASGKPLWTFNEVGVGPVSSPTLEGDVLFVNAPDMAAESPTPFSELAKEHDTDQDGKISRSEADGTWISEHYGWVDVDGDGSFTAPDWESINQVTDTDKWGINAIRIPGLQGEPELLWRNQQSVPYIPSPLVYDGVLYMVKDGIVSSLDPKTGEVHKRGRLTKGGPKMYASPVAGDGKIYFATLEGAVAVVKAGSDWEVLTINDLGEEIHASPAIVDGHLYVRTRSKLYSFAATQETQQTSP